MVLHVTWRCRPSVVVLATALVLASVGGTSAVGLLAPVYDTPLPNRIVVVRSTPGTPVHGVAPCAKSGGRGRPVRTARHCTAGMCLRVTLPRHNHPRPTLTPRRTPPPLQGVQAYPPFVVIRAWVGLDLTTLYTDLPGTPARGVLEGVNTSLIDGFDVAFLQLVLTQQLGIMDVVFKPYPDTVSLYVGLRNGEVDLIATAVEFDPTRAACNQAACPALNLSTEIAEFPTSDYGQPGYLARQAQICCVEYGTPYFQSGFAILSLSQPLPTSVVQAIVNVDVLNAGTPVVVALFSYGFVMTCIEWRGNKKMFSGIWSSAYYASVATATFGFGDMIPVSALGRGLTVFWTVFTVLSLTAFSGVVSSKLTVGSLSYTQINDFTSLMPGDLCIESSYPLVHSYVAGIYGLPLDASGRAAGVMHGSVGDCFNAVQNGSKQAFVDDFPLLQWLGFVYSQNSAWYVSPTLKPNPLTWAYPSGSPLKAVIDAAVMRTIVGNTWYPAAQSVVTEWLSTGTTNTGPPVGTVDWKWLAAAIAFIAFWLFFGSLENVLKMDLVQKQLARWSRRNQSLRHLVLSNYTTDPLVRLDAARKTARDAHVALDAALYELAIASAGAAAAVAHHDYRGGSDPKKIPHGDLGAEAPEAPAAL